jgi:hypothetical protein
MLWAGAATGKSSSQPQRSELRYDVAAGAVLDEGFAWQTVRDVKSMIGLHHIIGSSMMQAYHMMTKMGSENMSDHPMYAPCLCDRRQCGAQEAKRKECSVETGKLVLLVAFRVLDRLVLNEACRLVFDVCNGLRSLALSNHAFPIILLDGACSLATMGDGDPHTICACGSKQ